VRVTGKGDKQRLVPLGEPASESILNYLEIRSLMPVAVKHADFLFLNRRGHKLTREMIFHIVRKQTLSAGIGKRSLHILSDTPLLHIWLKWRRSQGCTGDARSLQYSDHRDLYARQFRKMEKIDN
jgi:site-specific recombinase XerD